MLTRLPMRLEADSKRVIARRCVPGDPARIGAIVDRALALPEEQVTDLLRQVAERYGRRHRDIDSVFLENFAHVVGDRNGHADISPSLKKLIGAYFTSEYSLESVALFNPSIVPHPDQSGVADDAVRFMMSLRACGEGHISSIEFRSGVIDAKGNVSMDDILPFAASEEPVDDHLHDKNRMFLKLNEMGAFSPPVNHVFQLLRDEFTIGELHEAIREAARSCSDRRLFHELTETLLWIARSSYRLEFPPESTMSERVIFPVTENESRGIEDARFVRFSGEEGNATYYATYTAYNGVQVLPQIIQTNDFARFRINTINGRCAQNKGMALFPRRVDGSFVMISRLDGENMYILRSDDIHFWNEGEKIHGPIHAWEFVQIGNCGSPLETDRGWLVITHGVGPMREYWIGAMLLDLRDPTKVIGHLKEPLLVPNEEERDGYVPNVVYSCGGMIHRDKLILPYGICDTATGFAVVPVDELLSRLTNP